jgi:hypothetical protein
MLLNRRNKMAKEDEIRLIAYSIWEQENCPNSKDCEHWYRAEAIWEKQQKSKAVVTSTKTQPKQATPKTNQFMPKRKR